MIEVCQLAVGGCKFEMIRKLTFGVCGSFAGISLEGSTLRPDDDASADVYGRKITAKEIVLGNKTAIPASGRLLVRILQKDAPHNESQKASNQ